jgi:hypothetical protein
LDIGVPRLFSTIIPMASNFVFELDAMGMMVENKRGTPISNSLLSVIDVLNRRQLAVI